MSANRILCHRIQSAFEKLQVTVPAREIEDIAFFVYRSHSSETRFFHDIHHILEMTETEDPSEMFAGLFHDIVYCQVDQGLHAQVRPLLEQWVSEGPEGISIKPGVDDVGVQLCLEIFQKRSGVVITVQQGLNELLSAMVAVRFLKSWLTLETLSEVVMCIEATIPFRAQNEASDPFQDLKSRWMFALVHAGGSLPSEHQSQEALTRAVRVANRDVANFADPEVGRFLSGTWQLLPEMNVSMRTPLRSSLRSYREAIEGMERFFATLRTDQIFHVDGLVISREMLKPQIERARFNREVSRKYLRVKLLTSLLFEFFAHETGGDAPISFFLGDLPSEGIAGPRLEQYLKSQPLQKFEKDPVALLLGKGRQAEVRFDLSQAPHSYFLYSTLGAEQCESLLEAALKVLKENGSRAAYLRSLPIEVLHPLVEGLSEMVPLRRAEFMKLKVLRSAA